ncbi:MAG: PriCT-2 domain-containing protein, partial [Selenomonadaceae bacterium]|nr:PriCT-2 domain-containing protein [Selenomonadaceae bacterium]
MKKIQVGTKRQWKELRKLFADMKTYFGTSRYYEACACELILRMIDEVDAHEQAGYEETRTACKLNNEEEITFAKALSGTVVNKIYNYNYSVHSAVYEDQAELSPKYTHDLRSITFNRRGLAFAINWSLTGSSNFSASVEIFFRDTKQEKTPADFCIIIPPPRDYDATRAQEPPEGVSAAAPVPSIPPAEIVSDAGKKNKPLQNSTAKETQGEDSMKKDDTQAKISKIGQADSTTDAAPMKPAVVTQQRIAEAEKFFNLLFGNVHEEKFGYLWTKQDKRTYPFAISKTDERHEMARKAIELNDAGFDVYYGVNLMDTKPADDTRATAEQVTLQTATITDIDVLGGSHTDPNKYPPTFDAAKSFLPFAVSILVDSGYGMHGLCLYSEPINITAENRDACKARNNKFIEVIRSRAGNYAGAVDGVGDLPRVLRVPGTFNYKLGKSSAPMCRIVEISDLRFTPADMDARLDALTPARTRPKQEAQPALIYDSRDFDIWRASQALETIPVSAMSRDEWLNIGMALKNNGNACTEWEQWSRNDERFKIGECENLWRGFNREGLTIATIIEIAMRYGYDAKAIQRQWFELHPELSNSARNPFYPSFTPPRDYKNNKYFTTEEVAKIIGVTKQTVIYWRKQKLFGEDVKTHEGVYLYLAERVYQLNEVYRRDWETAWRGDSNTPAPMDDVGEEKFVWTQDRIKSCPANLRLPADFTFSATGITQRVKSKKDT